MSIVCYNGNVSLQEVDIITYNDLLLQLCEVVKEVKKIENPNYKESDLFVSLNSLLNLEKICDDYFSRYDDLNETELETFNNFAALNGASRRKLKEDYKKAYDNKLIDKRLLDEYPGIMGYVSAIFMNELNGSFLNQNFVKTFNRMIKNVYVEDETLLNIFRMNSINYKRLYQGKENLGQLFKVTLKEFELLTAVQKNNGLNGIILTQAYDELLNLVQFNNSSIKKEKEFLAMNDFEKFENISRLITEMQESEEEKTSLANMFLGLQNSKYWFANQYLTLMLNITNQNSQIASLYHNKHMTYALGLFINYLGDDDFLKAVTIEENEQIVFKDLESLINKLQKYELKTIDYNISDDDKLHSFEGMQNIFNGVKEGKIKIDDLSSGYGSI